MNSKSGMINTTGYGLSSRKKSLGTNYGGGNSTSGAKIKNQKSHTNNFNRKNGTITKTNS